MKNFKLLLITIIIICGTKGKAQTENYLTLSQSFINLSLTNEKFDSIPNKRLSKIIPFIENQLSSITEKEFIASNSKLYNITHSYLYFLKGKIAYKNRTEINRDTLLQWKNTIDKAINYLNTAGINKNDNSFETNSYYIYTGFNLKSCMALDQEIEIQKGILNDLFNQKIYPDFTRIYNETKANPAYNYKEELTKIAGIFNIPIDFSIFESHNYYSKNNYSGNIKVEPNYKLTLALELLFQSLEIKSTVSSPKVALDDNSLYNLYDNYFSFAKTINPSNLLEYDNKYLRYDVIKKDSFFIAEFNQKFLDELNNQLQIKYPYKYVEKYKPRMVGESLSRKNKTKYYFPTPVPKPSDKFVINHFQINLKTLKQTNDYIKDCFIKAGYLGRLHYYYINEDGYAVTTSLERIQKNGEPAPSKPKEERWNLTPSYDGKFTLYEVFKAIFMSTESDFRMIACIISNNEVKTGKPAELKEIEGIIENNYSELPVDLENKIMLDKTLSIVVYHYSLSDVGAVPILLTQDRLSVIDHLTKTGALINLTK